jgi:hypothetical protein
MTTAHTPIGPALTFERGKKQPISVPLTTSASVALDLTGRTLVFRIGVPGSTALYSLTLGNGADPTLGIATGIIDADIAAGSYEYHVEDTGNDRILVRGACVIRAVIGA